MFCSECGEQNEADAKFCTNCGKKFSSATKAPSSSAEQSSSNQPSAPSPAAAYGHTELKESGTVTAMAVIGFVFGLIGMMGSFIPCIGSLAFYIGIPAALISAIALGIAYSQNAKKTFAVIAVTISLIGVVISGWQYFSIVSAGKNAERELKKMFNQEQQREAEQMYRKKEAEKSESQRMAQEKKQEGERALTAGLEAFKRGLYDLGIAELEKSWGFGEARALNELAWHFATCKDAHQHNGKRAVELALKLTTLKLNRWALPDNYVLGTLAAAYARNGQFEEAIKMQVRSISLGDIPGGEERLKLYRQGRPYQEK